MTSTSELVVVGVDGSDGAARALEYAAAEAERRGAQLRVVSVAMAPASWGVPYGMSPPMVAPKPYNVLDAAREVARDAADTVRSTHPDLKVETVALDGYPPTELVDQSSGADLLVLGHRGRGALASAVLGSVGLGCVLHARCPVTVVRQPA